MRAVDSSSVFKRLVKRISRRGWDVSLLDLSGFVKKTPKTPPQEIRKAHRIMKGLGL